jgi:hypothetical protein
MKFSIIKHKIRMSACVILTTFFLLASITTLAQAPTNIEITSAVQQASVYRLGVNLGDQSYWDSGQLLKNLSFRNPGFEGMKYRSIMRCATIVGTVCTDDNNYSTQPTGFFKGGTYLVMSGLAKGATGTVVASSKNPNSCSGCGPIIQLDQALALAVGDYVAVTTYIPGYGDEGWWDTTAGGGTITTETADLSPNTPGKQALVLNGTASGSKAAVTQYWDSVTGRSFTQMNGSFAVTFRAKGVGGTNQLAVNVQRSGTGLAPFLSQNVTLTSAWQDYTLTFNASETGTSVGTVGMAFTASGSAVELDDVSIEQTNSSSSNPTAFRDDVVNALKELQPGTIRMMAAGAALGSDLPNQLNVPFARYREGFNTGSYEVDDVAYGIDEFLHLCETVGADPWITIPTATTPAEMNDFMAYLSGTGSDAFSQSRIARGQSAPWTSVFNKIHLELGNETWNGDFKGEAMTYPGYPLWANDVFGAVKSHSGYVTGKFDLVLDGWASVPGYDSILLTYSNKHDSIDMAPYLLYSANNEAQSTMFGALFAEPELWESPGGEVYQNVLAAQLAPTPTNISVYETNLGTTLGTITQAQLNTLTPSVGAGIATADHSLQMMRLGVKYQNTFSLPQYQFRRNDGELATLWGIVVDMGTTNRRRPQFLTQALSNSVIGGTMLQTSQTGSNPTWNQPLSSDGVILNGAHYIQSFAFNNAGSTSVIVFNLNQTTALPVKFSGANALHGNVTMTQITSSNITDNNENSSVVAPVTKTLTGVTPGDQYSLPPFSMTVLTSSSTTTQAPVFSVPGGTYSSAQSVSISDQSSGATIYYTTDGSTPTTGSSVYSGSITVNKSETLQAMATASGLSQSAVTSATYTLSAATASTPNFSLAGGTYATAQSVAISDSTAGATIYYTTNGSTPTTSSTKYSGPIAISASETLNAIATASGYGTSAVATATYTISAGTAATPTFSVTPGTYNSNVTVAIAEATSGTTIYYTTNGTTPTTSSTRYSAPIMVSATTTIKAIAAGSSVKASAVATASYTIAPKVTAASAPTYSLKSGTYSSIQSLKLADATKGAVIYYSINGGGAIKYTGPITIGDSMTIVAGATATGYTTSAPTKLAYVIQLPTSAMPTFSVKAGTYTSAQVVTLADATKGSVIYYTTNGSTPSTASPKYTSPIKVTATETIKAAATATGYKSSPVASAEYVIGAEQTVAAPTFSVKAGTYTSAQEVALADATKGAVIYYTTNGSTPTTSSPKYTGAIKVSATETIKAAATATGYKSSPVASAEYVIKEEETVATPVFSLKAGTYTAAQEVTLADATKGALIYYTTNGTIPTTSSPKYSGAIKVSATETIKAAATATGYKSSPVASAEYVIKEAAAVATPVFSIAPGTYAVAQQVKISDATKGAVIYYTTNGSTPTTSSAKYTGVAIKISATGTLKAAATASGLQSSEVAVADYTITVAVAAAPKFSMGSGTYAETLYVSLYPTTPGSTIRFTVNGSTPTSSSTRYTSPIKVSASETVKAIAFAPGYEESAVLSAAYVIETPTTAVKFSLGSGSYVEEKFISIYPSMAGSEIYYTTNGSAPNKSSTKYTGPIPVLTTETINAIAVAPEHLASKVVTATYKMAIPTPMPTLSVKAGTYSSDISIVMKDADENAAIYYTTNGSAPTTASLRYNSPVKVSASATVKAMAIAPKFAKSATMIASYIIK